ncbi:hypothetical protein SprV_0401709700 [Sparganum proliferum]
MSRHEPRLNMNPDMSESMADAHSVTPQPGSDEGAVVTTVVPSTSPADEKTDSRCGVNKIVSFGRQLRSTKPLFAIHAVSPFHPIRALTFNLTVNAPVIYPNYLTSDRHRLIMSNDSTSQPIAGIHTFDLPSVWLDDITLGLRTVESRFALRQITRENTKFHYVVAAFPMDIATNLREIIDCPATEAPYTALKEALISRISLSTQKRLQRLISEKDFGDRKPTQLPRCLEQLADG